jgi:mono/diheme cytochrome c family protein
VGAVCVLVATLVLAACGDVSPRGGGTEPWYLQTTFDKFHLRASAGDADSQTLIGVMYFRGEGVRQDWSEAEFWFRSAALQGDELGRRNLDYLQDARAALAAADGGANADRAPAPASAGLTGSNRRSPYDTGEQIYGTFCAGCHGINGISNYVRSPSFAIGERLEKSDLELSVAIKNGKGTMPSWGDKFGKLAILEVVEFLRDLRRRYLLGIEMSPRQMPGSFYVFGPMTDQYGPSGPLLTDGFP